ncbi:RNA polymerase sigma factor SigJ [Frankia sp. AgB1.9]|uniref:RNA polymerase sigma factor SigJ n=1 Tax=unclassified Frankia TaxID=2632575 RepID=UPI001931C721|nr:MULTISPECIES: RNA polymerase sigma factor SigJ [unclassified Frankia]MBL7492898.1 RNA polymerase sigma factor SigJ [Frankia sp. AgW1.1]MBL7551247.1 RNA polymerase sigma factor SigJ [Frankia sp. AgB1.9]MBL7622783.1 RNA polymerase sigma factor SigJ [Frankia sp. AgB1.8]
MSADQEALAVAFQAARPRLVRVAYAILGSRGDAEDVVADCWLRLVAHHVEEPIRDPEAWAVVTVSRMAVDVLRSARVRRERYVGPWLPEPVLTTAAPEQGDPADRVTLDDEVSYALLVVLETLTPAERTAFVLHDLFGLPFPEVADIVGRTPASVRQLASRARRHIRDRAGRPVVDPAEHRRVVEAFAAAAGSGDLGTLIAVLDPEVVLVSDGGGFVTAARRPIQGADKVARFVLGVLAKGQLGSQIELVRVNGAPGFAVHEAGRLAAVVAFTVAAGRVARLDLVVAPDKLPREPRDA